MSQRVIHDGDPAASTTRVLLTCGAIAGPLFTLAWLIEGAIRAGYSALRHPISSLGIGELGWQQDATFIVTGLLTLALAIGLRRALQSRGGSTWGPLLVGAMAVGFFGAGLFVTDPINGYPPGTPARHVAYGSTHAALHDLFSTFVFLGLPIACFVLARLFARCGERGWAVYSVVSGVAFVVLFVVTSAGFAQTPGLVDIAGLLQRTTLTVGLGWMTLLALHLLRQPEPRRV